MLGSAGIAGEHDYNDAHDADDHDNNYAGKFFSFLSRPGCVSYATVATGIFVSLLLRLRTTISLRPLADVETVILFVAPGPLGVQFSLQGPIESKENSYTCQTLTRCSEPGSFTPTAREQNVPKPAPLPAYQHDYIHSGPSCRQLRTRTSAPSPSAHRSRSEHSRATSGANSCFGLFWFDGSCL